VTTHDLHDAPLAGLAAYGGTLLDPIDDDRDRALAVVSACDEGAVFATSKRDAVQPGEQVGDLARAALDGDERVDRRLAVARNHPELAKLSLTGRRKGRDKRGSEHDGESGMAHVINSLHHRRSESTGHPEP
jgi:hypothetical protein